MRAPFIVLVAGWWLFGCAHPQVPEAELAAATRASVCKVAIDRVIAAADTCPSAQLAIDAEPACREFGPLDLKCREWRR